MTSTDPTAADRERDDAEYYALKRQMRAEMTAVLNAVNAGESEQQQRTKAIKLARMLRDHGLSYEEDPRLTCRPRPGSSSRCGRPTRS